MNGENVYNALKILLTGVLVIIGLIFAPFVLVFIAGVILDLAVLAFFCSPVLLVIYLIWRWIRKRKGLST